MNIKRTNTSIGCQYDPTRAQPSHFEDSNECANHASHGGIGQTVQMWPGLGAGAQYFHLDSQILGRRYSHHARPRRLCCA